MVTLLGWDFKGAQRSLGPTQCQLLSSVQWGKATVVPLVPGHCPAPGSTGEVQQQFPFQEMGPVQY